ncbi:hypothetical protein ACOME3_006728 [Neoechinorhynchus agilis]
MTDDTNVDVKKNLSQSFSGRTTAFPRINISKVNHNDPEKKSNSLSRTRNCQNQKDFIKLNIATIGRGCDKTSSFNPRSLKQGTSGSLNILCRSPSLTSQKFMADWLRARQDLLRENDVQVKELTHNGASQSSGADSNESNNSYKKFARSKRFREIPAVVQSFRSEQEKQKAIRYATKGRVAFI